MTGEEAKTWAILADLPRCGILCNHIARRRPPGFSMADGGMCVCCAYKEGWNVAPYVHNCDGSLA